VKNIEPYLRAEIAAAIPGGLPHDYDIELEIPRDAAHGDLSTNIALRLAKHLKTAPTKIADSICKNFKIDLIISTASILPDRVSLILHTVENTFTR